MKGISTLKQLTEFTKKEKELLSFIFDEKEFSPSKSTVQSILNFSKSLSIRKSKTMGTFEMVLS